MGLGGFLDDIADGVGAVAKPVGKGIAFGYDKSGADSAVNKTVKPVYKKAVKPALGWLETAYTYGVSRPLTTALITDDWGDSWSQSWRASKDISPGQAFVGALGNKTGDLTRPLGVEAKDLPGVIGATADRSFDIRDAEDRKVFKSGSGMVFSGGMDALLRWFGDPTVVGGKAIAAGRTSTVVKPITGRTDVAKVGESRRVTTVVSRLAELSPTARYDAVMRDPAMRGNAALAQLVARADSPEKIRKFLVTGMDGSAGNFARLAEESEELASGLRNITDVRKPALEKKLTSLQDRWKGNPTNPRYGKSTQAKIDKQQAKMKALEVERIAAERGYDLARLLEQSAGTIDRVPRVSTSQRFSDNRWGSGGVTWATYQPSRFNAPMRVLKSASTRRAGAVTLDERGNATEQTRRLLDRAGHGLGRNFDPKLRMSLLANVTRAETGDPAVLVTALKEAELAVARHNGAALGIHPEVVERLAVEYQTRREFIQQTVSGGEAGAFSGGKVDGRFLDMFEDVDGELEHLAILNSQQANTHALMDMDAFTKQLRRTKGDLQGDAGLEVIKRMDELDSGSMRFTAADTISGVLDSWNKFWKPVMLMRLGYTVRNVTDEGMRSAAVLGAMTHLNLTIESAGNSLRSGDHPLLLKAANRATRRKQHKAGVKVDEMTGLRAQGMERAGIVDQLQDLAKAEAAVTKQIDKAQKGLLKAKGKQTRKVRKEDLKAARTEQRALAETRLELTGKRDSLTAWTEDMQADYMKYMMDAEPAAQARRGSPTRPAKFSGTRRVKTRSGVVEIDDLGEGPWGPMTLDLTSARATSRALAGVDTRYLNAQRLVAGEATTILPVPPQNIVDPGTRALWRESYDRGWERIVNDQLSKDPLARMLLKGYNDEAVVSWLRKSTAGREYAAKNPRGRGDLNEWVGVVRQQVDHYVPSPELKEIALAGNAKIDDLRLAAKADGVVDEDLPMIHGESLDLAMGTHPLPRVWAQMVDKVFEKIGTAPTDVMVRHPFAAGIYRREMVNGLNRLNLPKGATVKPEVVDELERRARYKAMREVKRTFYESANNSNFADATRFIMPFYGAWQDAVQTWGRLWMEDPSRLAHMFQAWEAPTKTPYYWEDAHGAEYMTLPVPGFVKNALPYQLDMPADTLKGLIFAGEYWYVAGVGAPVTIPTAELVRQRPELAELLKPLLPYGAGDDVLDQVLPPGWKRAVTLYSKQDDEEWNNTLTRMWQEVETDRRTGKWQGTEEEAYAESASRAEAYYTLRMAGNLGLPFSPHIKSPYQLYIDAWQTMSDEYRRDPGAFGGLTAFDAFVKEYGEDYIAFTQSLTKSNIGGIAPTVEGWKAYQKYDDLIAQMPEMGSLIVGDTNGDYSSSVATAMRQTAISEGDSRKLREVRDPRTAMIDLQVQRGWDEYSQISTAIEQARQQAGLPNLKVKDAAKLRVAKKFLVGKLNEKYPEWAKEFNNFDRGRVDRRVEFMETLVDDPRVEGRPGFASLAEYLATRRLVVEELKGRGSQNLTAKVNSDLRIAFEYRTQQLVQGDTAFEDIYNRWLQSDDLDTGGEAK